MRRSAVIIALAVVLLGLLAFAWFRSESEYQAKVRHGREMAAGLNAQFLADPRFRQVRALGYGKDSGPLWSEGSFCVTGTVFSSNDLMIVQSLVQSMNPPGKVECKINVVKPPQPVRPVMKSPAATNKPAVKPAIKTVPRKK
ncbi:hypothetical protein [Pedosphaera parvula]|uniref:BON domain-containing protein n=1 Tax=Pedosphaera parvula (strain Ellin514) TaxID=320771 RepID=B9XRI2_PEDPL|nr:hypothetical protein [Pedosphaera parvula]EEF57553.1 hypothetical protein Cflav_PD0603 [Pedosphaera parvula Ellin514]